MNNHFYIGIYWDRIDVSNEININRKIGLTLELLASIDNSLRDWYSTEKPKKNQQIILIDKNELNKLLHASRIYDSNGNIMSELGYSISLKSNKSFEKSTVLYLSCGIKNGVVPNSIVLTMEESNEIINNMHQLEKIFFGLIKIWEPERGLVSSTNLDEKLEPLSKYGVDFGVITFFLKKNDLLINESLIDFVESDLGYFAYLKSNLPSGARKNR